MKNGFTMPTFGENTLKNAFLTHENPETQGVTDSISSTGQAEWADKKKQFMQAIRNDITYAFSIFPATTDEYGLLTFKLRITPRDRMWVDFNQGPTLKQLESAEFISPYDILIAKITDDVNAFYSGIKLGTTAEQLLERHPNNAEIFRKTFETFRYIYARHYQGVKR